jgi:hypothetical protein
MIPGVNSPGFAKKLMTHKCKFCDTDIVVTGLSIYLSDEMPISMTSYPTRMNMMGILPKIGTGYLTVEKQIIYR